MTIAICFACGEFKVGAFTLCPACGAEPGTDENQARSLAFTDHYLPPEGLEQVRQCVVAGAPVAINPDFYGQLLHTIRADRQARASRPWWKCW